MQFRVPGVRFIIGLVAVQLTMIAPLWATVTRGSLERVTLDRWETLALSCSALTIAKLWNVERRQMAVVAILVTLLFVGLCWQTVQSHYAQETFSSSQFVLSFVPLTANSFLICMTFLVVFEPSILPVHLKAFDVLILVMLYLAFVVAVLSDMFRSSGLLESAVIASTAVVFGARFAKGACELWAAVVPDSTEDTGSEWGAP